MRYLVTGKEMKLLDQNTISHFGVPAELLMEQAAMGFVKELLCVYERPNHVVVICGQGNNGADGVAIARLLNQRGISTAIYVPESGKESDLMKLQLSIYRNYGYEEVELPNLSNFDMCIDAMFGIGLSRNIEEPYASIIATVNNANCKRVAVDIASGVNAETGEICGCAFCADSTIAFSFGKQGQYLWPGNEYSGRVIVAPIGITEDSFLDKKPKMATLEESDLSLLPERVAHSNKGTYGKLLVIAGSSNMAGNAAFAANAAYRMGTGLVKVLTAEENRTAMFTLAPEAVLSTYSDYLDPNEVIASINWADAIVLGPGIGKSEISRALVRLVLEKADVPLVIDADGLNILAEDLSLLQGHKQEIILTPHLGEMGRLLGQPVNYIQENLVETARNFANDYDVTLVLKDFHTVIAKPYGMTYLNLSGNDGMATAGSGDVLSGIIGGLCANRCKEAAELGVYIHGLSGDVAKQYVGKRAMIASDLIAGLCEVLKSY